MAACEESQAAAVCIYVYVYVHVGSCQVWVPFLYLTVPFWDTGAHPRAFLLPTFMYCNAWLQQSVPKQLISFSSFSSASEPRLSPWKVQVELGVRGSEC